jgi:hypothetical protein
VKSNFFLSFIRALKLPLKLLGNWLKIKSKRRKNDLEKKQLAYVRNFSPKHYSWQKNLGKDKKASKRKQVHLKEKLRKTSKN